MFLYVRNNPPGHTTDDTSRSKWRNPDSNIYVSTFGRHSWISSAEMTIRNGNNHFKIMAISGSVVDHLGDKMPQTRLDSAQLMHRPSISHRIKASFFVLCCGYIASSSWWRHQMEIFSALLAICAGNSPVTGELPTQRPVTQSFGNLWLISSHGSHAYSLAYVLCFYGVCRSEMLYHFHDDTT